MRRSVLALAAGLGMSTLVHAQGDTAMVRVRGVAFDSLRGVPLADAFVAIGGARTTTSDARGRFEFERVPAGTYLMTLQHEALDTLGFPGLSTRVKVTDGRDEVRIAVPSFATLWKTVCGEGRAPSDSGFVYGTVRDARTSAVVANANILVIWHDSVRRIGSLASSMATRDREAIANAPRPVFVPPRTDARRSATTEEREPQWAKPTLDLDPGPRMARVDWERRGRSDESGTYAVCGVPTSSHGVRVYASTATTGSDSIAVVIDPRVVRRDLRVGSSSPGIEGRGTVIGEITDHTGAPFPHARVVSAGVEGRSDDSGRFVLRNVPAGTRQVEVRFVGMTPAHGRVDVVAGDTASVAVRVSRIPTLSGMSVRSTTLGRVMALEFQTRRKAGLGYIMDSASIAKYPSVPNVLRDVPGLQSTLRGASLSAQVPDGRGGMCTPSVWLDGLEAGYGNLLDLSTSELVGLEVYIRPLTVPTAFVDQGGEQKCGAILAWTRYLFKNR